MLLAVERVALLRHVEMFARTPGRQLAGLADVLEEADFHAGDTLMAEGAVEDWMFVVVDGEVEVTRADRSVRLQAVTVVGEMGVLDSRPRSGTVVARTPVRTLRLSRPAFEESLRMSPEIAHGVIIELVRRLRETHVAPPGG